nr:MAG TPA: Cytosine specific methyltransferase [Caudoviricetes sp.]
MKHLGDITKMSGFSTPPVDVITFGSPCQDLSIAGKRAGLSGERSGLFMEAVRIIKEMREATNGEYPKYAVWENVPGAFSSNKGEDFRAVLEELARIKEAGISIPVPDKSKWAKAGLITGDDWSIAWRTMDAQYWGVPQRRLRISLVLDLTGGRAGEILFEPESLRGHFAPGVTPGQATAGTAQNGAGTADRAFTLKIRSGCEGGGKGALVQTEKSATLSTLQDQTLFVAEPSDPAKNQGGIAILDALPFDTTQITSPQNGSKPHFGDPCHPLAATAHPPAAVCIECRNMTANEELSATLQAKSNGGQSLNYINPVCYAATTEPNMVICDDCSPAIRSRDYKDPNIVCYDARGNGDGQTSPTITGDHNSRVTDYTTIIVEKIIRWVVRRLTPTECERLQGYPDGWTDLGEWVDGKGKAHKPADTPRYKALGNSIALPQWYYVLGGIADRLPDDATLGSLFDGIGGFPYVWAKLHNDNKSLCVWASEIEDFPIAVTKKWFPE